MEETVPVASHRHLFLADSLCASHAQGHALYQVPFCFTKNEINMAEN